MPAPAADYLRRRESPDSNSSMMCLAALAALRLSATHSRLVAAFAARSPSEASRNSRTASAIVRGSRATSGTRVRHCRQRHAREIGCDDRGATANRLEHRVRHPLSRTDREEHVGGAEQVGDIGYPIDHPDVVRDAQLAGSILRRVPSPLRQREHSIASRPEEIGHRPQEEIAALDPPVPAKMEQYLRVSRYVEPAAGLGPPGHVEQWELIGVDATRDDLDSAFGHAASVELARHVARETNDPIEAPRERGELRHVSGNRKGPPAEDRVNVPVAMSALTSRLEQRDRDVPRREVRVHHHRTALVSNQRPKPRRALPTAQLGHKVDRRSVEPELSDPFVLPRGAGQDEVNSPSALDGLPAERGRA